MTTRWDAEYRAHQAEQRRLRYARDFNARITTEELREGSSNRWPEAKRVNPDEDE